MSINYCTIGKDRVDGFCGNQRAKILARLIHEAGHDIIVVPPQPPRPIGGGSAIGGGFNFHPAVQQPMYRPPDINDKPLPPVEQPIITVSAKIFDMFGSETLEATQRLDFVVVTDLEFGSSPTVAVTELQMNVAPEITVNISEMEI